MTDVKDRFDRASLGANWESPTGNAANGTFQMLNPAKDAVGMDPAKLNSRRTYGRWIANEFNPRYQWVEIEVATKDWDVSDYYAAYDDYAAYYLVLNQPTTAEYASDKSAFYFSFTVWNSVSYDPIFLTVFQTNAAGNIINGGGFGESIYLPYDDFFNTDVLSAGVKFRAERIDDQVYFFLYSNQRNKWYHIPHEATGLDINALTHTGIGFGLYAIDNADDCEATNFRAGDELKDLLGPTLLGIDMADGTVQTLAADGSTTQITTIGPLYISVSEGTWGGGTLTFERLNAAGEWKDIVGASYTADFNEVVDFPEGAKNIVRATLASSTTPDLDVEIQYSGQAS